MKITISTSSKNVFNILENHIERLERYLIEGKCTKYRSENDFIESLYDIAIYLTNTNTCLDSHSDWYHYPNTERHVKLVCSTRATYTKTFSLESSIFTYP